MKTEKSVSIYGCGGAGVNILQRFSKGKLDNLIGSVTPTYVDTSRSNLEPDTAEENVFLLEGVDGSGKIRRENSGAISKVIKNMLHEHTPGEFNIVLFSASGGSGSVFGPLIVAELLARDIPVVPLVIGTDESIICANNTLNTLKSLEGISARQDKTVCTYYEHFTRKDTRNEADASIIHAMTMLVLAGAGNVRELDSSDIFNWLQYDRVSNLPPTLAMLGAEVDPKEVDELPDVVSVLSIRKSPNEPTYESIVPYNADGYMDIPLDDIDNVYLAVTATGIDRVVERIMGTLKAMEEDEGSRVKRTRIFDTDEADDDGMVL